MKDNKPLSVKELQKILSKFNENEEIVVKINNDEVKDITTISYKNNKIILNLS